MANKAPGSGTEGQQQANGEKESPAVPSAPPSYEEATSGEGLKAGAFPAAPSGVPLHPVWAYVDPSKSLSSWRLEYQGREGLTWETWAGRSCLEILAAACGCCMRLLSKSWGLRAGQGPREKGGGQRLQSEGSWLGISHQTEAGRKTKG